MFNKQVQCFPLAGALVCLGDRDLFTGDMRTRAWHSGLGVCAEREGGMA